MASCKWCLETKCPRKAVGSGIEGGVGGGSDICPLGLSQ